MRHRARTVTDVTPATDTLGLGGRRPFLIGIGGCGMSALARLLQSGGLSVRGSDMVASEVTEGLRAGGIEVVEEASGGGLPESCDVVVASAAVRPDHPLVLEAERRGVAVLSYSEALGRLMARRTGIAVAGTHGKSTTAAMLGCALVDAGLDPAVIVGAVCPQLGAGALAPAGSGTGFRLGSASVPSGPLASSPGLLVAEACEYNRSFHNLRPVIASISAVEADHLDVYGSLDQVVEAFAEFARLVRPASEGGVLLIAHEGAHRREVTAGVSSDVQTVGFSPSADWEVGFDPGSRAVSVRGPRGVRGAWVASMAGEHNAMNGATAFALGCLAGGDPARLAASLGAFAGLERRMQYLGERLGVRVFDDYGHHPTEVEATLRALRQSERPEARAGRLICVFQPHQHSRTRFLLEEFAASFSQADVVIVPQIYFVRDSQAEKHKVCSADLVDRLRRLGVRAMHLHPFEAIVEQLENLCRAGDLLVVMGAGPVWRVGRQFLDTGVETGDRA